jgi:hypothetical protein
LSKQNAPRPAQKKDKQRKEPPRLLASNPGASGPRWIKDKETGDWIRDPKDDGQRDYTSRTDKAAKGEPEAVSEGEQEEITIRANLRDAERFWEQGDFPQARVMANQLVRRQRRAVKYGLDFAPRITALLREMDAELAQKRSEAA